MDNGQISANDLNNIEKQLRETKRKLAQKREGYFDANKSFPKAGIKRNF
jgi:hypothetical protein